MEAHLSSSYWHRQYLMSTLEVPTISMTKQELGLPLALVAFEQCYPGLKQECGLEPPLQGATGDLWTSPSDLLIGKVCLKPPLTQKHIQALTHQGILDIGTTIERKFWNEMEMDKMQAVQQKETFLKNLFEFEKAALVKETREEERWKYMQQLDEQQSEYEGRIYQLLLECYGQVKEIEEEMADKNNKLNADWQQKMDEEVTKIVLGITEEFLEKLRLQEITLAEIFNKKINMINLKRKYSVDFERSRCKQLLRQIQHQMECDNISNLMYMLCKERRKCKAEKQAMEKKYSTEIAKRNTTIKIKNKTIKRLIQIKNRKIKQLEIRDKCLKEILKQFQKFIYFALKAVPTQGEFLLNIHKLLQYELADYCILPEQYTSKKTVDASNLIGESKTEKKFVDIKPVTTHSTSTDEEQLQQSDELPAFYFNDKFYVREDFRDMVLSGVEIDRKHPLWNDDVAELINIFKASISDKRLNSQSQSSVHFHLSLPDISTVSKPIVPINFSDEEVRDLHEPAIGNETQTQEAAVSEPPTPGDILVQKASLSEVPDEEELNKFTLDQDTTEVIAEFKKEKRVRKLSITERTSIGSQPKSISNELLTLTIRHEDPFDSTRPSLFSSIPENSSRHIAEVRDSVIVHISAIEKKSLQNLYKSATELPLTFSHDGAIRLKGDEEDSASHSISTGTAEKQDVLSTASLHYESSKTSKLVLATDSLEIIRSCVAINIEKDARMQEKAVQTSLWSIPRRSSIFKNVKKPPRTLKPTPAKIVGPRKTKKQERTPEDFIQNRLKSVINIMKDSPSLIRLFTPCSK